MNNSGNQNKRKIIPPKKKSTGKIVVIVIMIVIFAIVALSASFLSLYKPNVDNNLPFETDDSNNTSQNPNNPNQPDVAPIVDKGSSNYTRKEGVYNFLVVGKDSVALNTDVMMLVSFDVKNSSLSIMQIPRDTYIEIGKYSHKINAAYATLYVQARKNGEKDLENAGMSGLVDILQKNMNLKIDYYALINLDGFRNIIDIMGGIEMDVPFSMDYEDPYQDLYIHIKKGPQVLDGKKSEQFVRFRDDYVEGDIGRVTAQKIFMTALVKQMKKSITIDKIPKLVEQAITNVNTSISLPDCIYFVKEALKMDLEKIHLITLPGQEARENGDSGAWYYIMNRESGLAIINQYFNVYNTPISDSIFDKNYAFTNEDISHIYNIYINPLGENGTSSNLTAGDIDKELPHIPLLNR